jgi:hypothetical protein
MCLHVAADFSKWLGRGETVVLVVLTDGRLLEVGNAVDVVRGRGRLLCLDPNGATVVSVALEECLAYTLNPEVAIAMRDGASVIQARSLTNSSGLFSESLSVE